MTETQLYSRFERETVYAMLASSDEISQSLALDILSVEDFTDGKLLALFQAVGTVLREGEGYSVERLLLQLESDGTLKKIGGQEQLFSFFEQGKRHLLSAPAHVYARSLKDLSSKRIIREKLKETESDFSESSGMSSLDAASTLQNFLNERIYNLSDSTDYTVEFGSSFSKYKELLESRAEKAKEGSLLGIPTLLPTLDSFTTGWQPGQLITVGARTGIGKSIFAINCATASSSAGRSTLMFSLEMSDEEIMDRVYSSVSGIPMNKLKHASELTATERVQLEDAGKLISGWKLKVDTTPNVTVDVIRSKSLEYARQNGLDLIIVDYLQLVEPTEKGDSRQVEVQKLSRSMKLLAKQLNIPIIVLVQLNRESKDDENAMPKLSQIRESGAIAQDSNVVILIHRDNTDDGTIPQTTIILAKNRNGPANKYIHCHSHLSTSTFIEMRKKQEERATEEDEQEAFDSIDELGWDEVEPSWNEESPTFDEDLPFELG